MRKILVLFFTAFVLSGCVPWTLDSVTITPGASASQIPSTGKEIHTLGGTVGFTFRPVRPSPSPSPTPASPTQSGNSPSNVRGTSPIYPPPR